jgi:hypothetical protein
LVTSNIALHVKTVLSAREAERIVLDVCGDKFLRIYLVITVRLLTVVVMMVTIVLDNRAIIFLPILTNTGRSVIESVLFRRLYAVVY